MGSVSSAKQHSDEKLINYPARECPQKVIQREDDKHKKSKKLHRIQACKYNEKCPSIKNIKHKHCTLYDLNHLTAYSHTRKRCLDGTNCKYFENVMNGSHSMQDLCHYAIYLHPTAKFITSLKTPTNEQTNTGTNTNTSINIMMCDGSCGNSINRGLCKIWNFRHLIWTFKHRKYKKKYDKNENIRSMLITMIESVIALVGDTFLNEMYNLMTMNDQKTEFGSLLLSFSIVVRKEFGLNDDKYPILKKEKKWQNPIIYGVLIGIMNDKLNGTKVQKLKNDIFIKGCHHLRRDLFKELQCNNFSNILSISSLQQVAREKLNHPRHLEMGSCLEEDELLSILLFSGTKVGLDMIESHRKYKNYCKWRILQIKLQSALTKLHLRSEMNANYECFHGLLLNDAKNESYYGLFDTFLSTTSDDQLIKSLFDNKQNETLLALNCKQTQMICADISWISKFPFEHEIVFAPSNCSLTSNIKISENKVGIAQNVEKIRLFCCEQINLYELWTHFTAKNDKESSKEMDITMDYDQFEKMIYSALAYFVSARNPNDELATKESLRPLIEQLKMSLLTAYDPNGRGFVTFDVFGCFGEYLAQEYVKLQRLLNEQQVIGDNDEVHQDSFRN